MFIFFLLYRRANKLKFNNAEYQKTPQQDEKLPAVSDNLDKVFSQLFRKFLN